MEAESLERLPHRLAALECLDALLAVEYDGKGRTFLTEMRTAVLAIYLVGAQQLLVECSIMSASPFSARIPRPGNWKSRTSKTEKNRRYMR